jgi:hypothetical protein
LCQQHNATTVRFFCNLWNLWFAVSVVPHLLPMDSENLNVSFSDCVMVSFTVPSAVSIHLIAPAITVVHLLLFMPVWTLTAYIFSIN